MRRVRRERSRATEDFLCPCGDPTLAEVGTKVIYPRIQEGNGENAQVGAAQVRALVSGLQGGPELNPKSVLATVKNWPGEGAGGEAGITYDAVTIRYHMIPFKAAMEAGAVNIMPGYAGSSFLDPGGLGAGDSAPILAYLRQNLGYTGLITTDWLPSGDPWIRSANAGSDVMGGADPGAVGFAMSDFTNAVPISRIDDAVRRALRLKFQLGIFENPYGDPVNGPFRWHTPAYAALANQASRESMTLLKNSGVLPVKLAAGDNIVVAGARAADPLACCIWTSYFHQNYGSLDILDAIKARAKTAGVNVFQDTAPSPKLAIVVVGEGSYTHATSWVKEQPYLPADQLAIIQNFKNQGIPVVVLLVLPRPYVITEWNGQPALRRLCPKRKAALATAAKPGPGAEAGRYRHAGRRAGKLGSAVRPRCYSRRARRYPGEDRRRSEPAVDVRQPALSLWCRHAGLVGARDWWRRQLASQTQAAQLGRVITGASDGRAERSSPYNRARSGS